MSLVFNRLGSLSYQGKLLKEATKVNQSRINLSFNSTKTNMAPFPPHSNGA